MYHRHRVYDISFVSVLPNSPRGPEIVFATHRKNLEPLRKQICFSIKRTEEYISDYFGEFTEFPLFEQNLFGEIEFGFGSCGRVYQDREDLCLGIEIRRGKGVSNAAYTIHLLTQCFRFLNDNEFYPINRTQQIDIEALSFLGAHGHSVGGYVSAEMLAWMKSYHAKHAQGNYIVAAPKEVYQSMMKVWRIVTRQGTQIRKDDCSAGIAQDGRFYFTCIGNACDLAIYPDQIREGIEGTRFGCHNLDASSQQLTLLAGLAKLCELARAER